MRAYSYVRWSTDEQAHGDSLRRQIEAARQYAQAHGLELVEDYRDAGVSAYRGRNLAGGSALRQFLRAVEDGVIEQGSYLLVESLDRISRLNPVDAVPKFLEIVNLGVTVVTLADGMVYDSKSLRDNMAGLFVSLAVMVRAHEESRTKSRRLKAVWSSKRTQATEKPLTKRAPGWLQLTSEGRWEVIEEHAETLREIYDRHLRGEGVYAIAKALNEAKVPTWGRRGTTWTRTTIQYLLHTPTVIGTLVTHEMVDGRKSKLSEVPGYFPAVIDKNIYEAIQARTPGTAPRKTEEMTSVLTGLATCPHCGSKMVSTSRTRGGNRYRYMVCNKAKSGGGCKFEFSRVETLDTAIRQAIPQLVADPPAPDEKLEVDRRSTRVAIDETQETLRRLSKALQANPLSKTLARELSATEASLESLEATLRGLEERIEKTQGPALARRLDELQRVQHEANKTVNAALRGILSRAIVDRTAGRIRLVWHSGAVSEVVYGWPEE